jgi:hypothetical protein
MTNSTGDSSENCQKIGCFHKNTGDVWHSKSAIEKKCEGLEKQEVSRRDWINRFPLSLPRPPLSGHARFPTFPHFPARPHFPVDRV